MKDRLLERIHSHREEILSFTQDLIAVPTENPPGRSYRECAEVIKRMLEEIGLSFQKVESPAREGQASGPSLLAFHGTGKKVLYFHGHYDVVPAQDEKQFAPALQGPNLFGRGSSDMKGGLAAMIFAVRALKESGVSLGGRVGLVLVPDEETGGERGSKHLAAAGILGKDGIGMLTPEPTGGIVWNASRGALSLRITVRGKPAHVGLHYQGVNAFEGMLRVARALEDLKREVETRKTGYRIRPEAARSSVLMLGGKSGGGANFNVVPELCSFTVDRRFNPEEDPGEEKQRILAILDRFRKEGLDLVTEVLQEAPAAGCPKDHEVARALAESVEAIKGKAPEFALCPGLLEIRFYVAREVPAYAYGPGLLSVSHGPNEFVNVDDVLDCASIYALTAVKLLGGRD